MCSGLARSLYPLSYLRKPELEFVVVAAGENNRRGFVMTGEKPRSLSLKETAGSHSEYSVLNQSPVG
jgi:hypothetical protein